MSRDRGGVEGRPLSRRTFIRAAGVAGAGFVLYAYAPGGATRAVAAIPGGTLDPLAVPKFVTPMLVPPVMPRAGTIRRKGGKPVDYYEISVRQLSQQILPVGLPATTVWGYGAVQSASRRGLRVHHAPSLTIEARWKRPVRVKWVNDLVDRSGNYLPHLLPVDPTLHWANPPGGDDGRDSRPTFAATPDAYTGPVPLVTHVHGAVGVGDESDGYAEAWFLPAARNVPPGYATEGTWHSFFRGKASSALGLEWGPGFVTFEYPNDQRASTLWYHDHTLGMTRLNVYAGPAGFFLVRGGPQGDRAIRDSRSGEMAVLPGPAPKEGDTFPSRKTYFELPIVIQDRAFNEDGSLFYPNSREFFDGATAQNPGFVPATDLSPIWNPEFFGNAIMVNGNTWPFQVVQQRRYRLRLLNGCQARFLVLDFSRIPGAQVWAIGNEGGFLAAPVDLTATNGSRLLMAPAERADLVVDFTNVPEGSYVLGNEGPDEPFGGGEPGSDFEGADPRTTGQVLQFRVVAPVSPDPSTPPQFLVLPPPPSLPARTRTRRLALIEMMSSAWDGPAEAMLGELDADGHPVHRMWMDEVTENPSVGDTEVWEVYNFTADAHPIHIHETTFQVADRQALVTNEDGEAEAPARLAGEPRPPEGWETGYKDTVIAYPGEVTRVRARFTRAGQYTWHCHIVEHEDNEMMRPYRIGPAQAGQPSG
ncbi:multicopper oxidase family protein [Terrabacter sp. C0L_2]|uniref:multicopper oxidase family protein n=1 Tax=Terrabacter sp. C0L_2 TaxID=3108389 RepID=UPI002ED5C303|nr:multicopper oxidase [Terrabacter sp. C0L_2]